MLDINNLRKDLAGVIARFSPVMRAVTAFANGCPNNGIENQKSGIMTRGIIVDIPRMKNLPYLEPGTGSVLEYTKAVAAGDAFVVVDVETTGTDPKMADLLEIAAVKVKKGKITDRWSTLVNPGRAILGNQMHGITDKDVAKAPSPADAAAQAVKFIGGATIVGHSVGFDLGFLEAALADGTEPSSTASPHQLDTWTWSWSRGSTPAPYCWTASR